MGLGSYGLPFGNRQFFLGKVGPVKNLADYTHVIWATKPSILEDFDECIKWAKQNLDHFSEQYSDLKPAGHFKLGDGWVIEPIEEAGKWVASISRPSWRADHVGELQDTAILAVIEATLELTRGKINL